MPGTVIDAFAQLTHCRSAASGESPTHSDEPNRGTTSKSLVGCSGRSVRDFGFCRLTQTACLSILNCSRVFSPLDPHFPISRRCTVRLSCVLGFLVVIQRR